MAGVVYALLEDNGTTDSLMRIGHRVFGQAFHDEINDYVKPADFEALLKKKGIISS